MQRWQRAVPACEADCSSPHLRDLAYHRLALLFRPRATSPLRSVCNRAPLSPRLTSPQKRLQVDRSAAYAARQAAKSVVASRLARRCLLQLSYSIGVAEPLSVFLDTYGTGVAPDEEIAAAVMRGGRAAAQGGGVRGAREGSVLGRPTAVRVPLPTRLLRVAQGTPAPSQLGLRGWRDQRKE